MVWSAIGKVLLRTAPIALELAEASTHSGAGKTMVYQKALSDSIAEFRPDIAKHPKVVAALQKIADANVEAQNIISQLIVDRPVPDVMGVDWGM